MFLFLLACATRTPPVPTAAVAPQMVTGVLRVADHLSQPAPLAEPMADYFDVQLLIEATWQTGGALQLRLASWQDGVQHDCAETTTVRDLGLADDGGFSTTIARLPITADDVSFAMDDLSLVGRVTPDTLTLSAVSGRLDTRPLAPLLDPNQPMALCTMLGKMVPCEPCADDVAACWDIGLTDVSLTPVAVGLEQRDGC